MVYYLCSGGITLCGNTKSNSTLFPITNFEYSLLNTKEPWDGLFCVFTVVFSVSCAKIVVTQIEHFAGLVK